MADMREVEAIAATVRILGGENPQSDEHFAHAANQMADDKMRERVEAHGWMSILAAVLVEDGQSVAEAAEATGLSEESVSIAAEEPNTQLRGEAKAHVRALLDEAGEGES